jgi:RNA polymerase sigma-70 factor (ECF subfamily)
MTSVTATISNQSTADFGQWSQQDNIGQGQRSASGATTIARLEQAVRLHQPQLLGRARRWTGDNADAWDLVQDTFLRAQNALSSKVPDARMVGWLTVIMRNTFIDRTRAVRRLRLAPLESAREWDLCAAAPSEASEDLRSWELLGKSDIEAAIAALPSPFRAVLELREIQGLSYREISSRLDLDSSTVGTRILRARRALRRLLERAATARTACRSDLPSQMATARLQREAKRSARHRLASPIVARNSEAA